MANNGGTMNKIMIEVAKVEKYEGIKQSSKGAAYLSFLVCETPQKNSRYGIRHRVVMFGDAAIQFDVEMKRGLELFTLTGRLNYGNYEKDGKKVYTTDIIGNEISDCKYAASSNRSESPLKKSYNVESNDMFAGDDIPF